MPTVLVTGAGRGIGLATTERLAGAGWQVYAGARSADHLAALGALANVHPVRLDVTDPDAVAALTDVLPDRLDAVVNNAGIVVQGPVEGVAPADIARQLDVNVTGQIAVTQAVLPLLRASAGRIVFISSVSGRVTTPGTGVYSASKYALESLADALRIELRPWKIGVSLVEPGTTHTDIWTGMLDAFDAMVSGLSDEHRRLYASQNAGMRRLLPRLQKTAVPPEKVATAVERALTDRRPRPRYLCDAPSRAQVALSAVTPTRVTDLVLSVATRKG
ncbi:retinol dehydrogenase [Williamsia sp. Leaf354]|uniref:SDR family oxidoreductase n=1 Tax=Williamsia sp. Leaf354 TaxID=1736349 RepID=UPI0007010B20|nr:SDR family oxidoreductase [Williamsia sp. Leaf354]KQR97286.1 retinol dehydrogenase [Williamsia sp. Leaf354]